MTLKTLANRILTGIVLTVPGIAQAQQSAPAGPPQGLQFEVTALAATQMDADVDSGGSVASSRWYLQSGLRNALGTGHSFGVVVGVGQTFYDIDGPNRLTGSIDVDEVRVSVPVRFALSESAMAMVVPQFSYAGQNGASLGEASTWGMLGSVAWRLGQSLTIGPGLGLVTTLEDDVQAFPFLFIDWAITERWSLSTGRGLAASRGPGLSLTYQATQAWSFGLIGRYEEFEVRLDEDHDTAGGTLTDRSIPVVASGTWSPNPGISVTGYAGYAYGGSLELRDADGSKLDDSEYDPAPILGISARLRF